MNPELINMALNGDNHLTPENQSKLDTLINQAKTLISEYQFKIKTGEFINTNIDTDKTSEQLDLEKRITDIVNKAEKIKRGEEIEEDESPEPTESINVQYQYTNPDTNQVEYQEDINIDIEQQIQEHLAFYKKTNIDLPPNFEDTIRAIWNRNYTEIQSQIEQFGFNGILIAPANIPLDELLKKMKMENGYRNWITASGDIIPDLKNIPLQSTGTDKPRIILYHKKTLPEIQKQNGIDPHLNITAEKAQKLYDANPDKFISTLEDAIILERKHFDETGVHISNYNTKSGVWLSGTKQQGSTRFVDSGWSPGSSALSVGAYDALFSGSALGCRPSCYFI